MKEHIIERWLCEEPGPPDRDAPAGRQAEDNGHRLRCVGDRQEDAVAGDPRVPDGRLPGRSRSSDGRLSAGSLGVMAIVFSKYRCFSSPGVPSATSRPRSTIASRPLSRSASSR